MSVAAVAAATLGCTEDQTTAAVGAACLPRDESEPGFAGFGAQETTIETANGYCAAESVCLVSSFRGRVSCPYGQTAADLEAGTPRCFIPKHGDMTVQVEVEAQLLDTAGAKGVYCSALCADANGKRPDGRSYHDCPSGFHCELLSDSLLAQPQSLAGSYCIRDGSPSKSTLSPESCVMSDDSKGNCGSARPYR